MKLAEIRKQYLLNELKEEEVGNDPLSFFNKWLSEAISAGVPEPTAMVLSTISSDNKPSSRVVLLKSCEEGRFIFFTNYHSAKGKQLESNPNASVLFFWKELERQIRIEGSTVKLSEETSDEYFNSRPAESRLGAIISPQSQVIESREAIEKLYESKIYLLDNQKDLVRPQHWGGYALIPESIEFWQGRASRLHDRIRFRKADNLWIRERLAP
jgi:pyridoxamine 5'-phosphate oxidase